MKYIIAIALLLRTASNIQQYSDPLYFLGRDIVELILLIAVYKSSKGLLRQVILICALQTLWNAFKPLVTNPRANDYWEIIGFVLGIIITIIVYYVKKYNNHSK